MRESDKWALRSISPSNDTLGILAAIFENDSTNENGNCRTSHGRIKIIVDQDKEERRTSAGDRRERAVEITARITVLEFDQYRLELEGFSGSFTSSDRVAKSDLLAVFLKRCKLVSQNHVVP